LFGALQWIDRGRIAWVALVDGNNHQIDRVQAEARARQVDVTIVVDFVHVLEYLWKAAWCFYKEGDPDAERWVRDRARQILAGQVPATVLQAVVLGRTVGPRALAWVPATLLPVQLSGWVGSLSFLALLILLGSTIPSWQSVDWLAFAVIACGFAAGGVPVVICQWVVLRPLSRAVRWLWLAWLPGLVFGPAWFLGVPSDVPGGWILATLGAVAVYGLATAAVLPVQHAVPCASGDRQHRQGAS
jgi:hypothetical protein